MCVCVQSARDFQSKYLPAVVYTCWSSWSSSLECLQSSSSFNKTRLITSVAIVCSHMSKNDELVCVCICVFGYILLMLVDNNTYC